MGDSSPTPRGVCERLMTLYQRDHEAATNHHFVEKAYTLHGLAHEALLVLEAPGEHVPARSARELERLVFLVAVTEAVDDPARGFYWREVHEWLVRYQGVAERATTQPRRALVDVSAVG